MSLLAELRRRNVIRMAGLYVVGAWLIVQVAETLLPIFQTPDWVLKALIVLLAIGLVPALVFSWIYELTPEGLKREGDIDRSQRVDPTARRLDIVVIVLLLVVGALMIWKPERPDRASASSNAASGEAAANPAADPDPVSNAGRGSGSAPASTAAFIAVLPFENYSPDPADAYFASGMTEEITSQLSRVSALRVVSRTAVSRALESQSSLADIATTLGVGSVLEGSVRKAGDKVRITTQLVDPVSGQQLWSTDFDRELADVFAIQREVALAIVDALNAELTPTEQARIDAPPTDDLAAYQLYLRSQEFSATGVATNRTAIELLRQSVALDPDFGEAWARLSWRHTWAARLGERSAVEEAFSTARRALELQPQSPEAHFALGSAYSVSEEVGPVIAAFERAVALDPDDRTLLDLSLINASTGRPALALAQVSRYVRLSRNVPNVRWHAGVVLEQLGDDRRLEDWLELAEAEGLQMHRLDLLRAWLHARQGRPDAAMSVLRVGQERWSGNEEFERGNAAVRLLLGHGGEVRGFLERQAQLAPDSSGWLEGAGSGRTQFARLLFESGEAERAAPLFTESLRINEQMFGASRGWPDRWLESAVIHALHGRREEAMRWLERTAQSGLNVPDFLARDRAFDGLRDDPRFAAVVRHMRDAQAAERARVEAEGIAAELDAMIAAKPGKAP